MPLKAPTYVTQGLTKCSLPDFNGPFELMLNQERVTQMGMDVSLVNTSSVTLKHVLHIIVLANNSYHSLNNFNAWNVPQGKRGHHSAQKPHHTPECFNCGKTHPLPDCKHDCDEAKIARNRRAYMNKRPDGSRNNGHKKWSKGGRGEGGGHGLGNPDRNAASGLQLMGKSRCVFASARNVDGIRPILLGFILHGCRTSLLLLSPRPTSSVLRLALRLNPLKRVNMPLMLRLMATS